MINRVLVANRAEIASRVFRTCRRLGIATVAVHSDADAALPYVGEADVAVHLPGTTPAETYLRGDLVIEAAQRTGADAIHPGYGFLSENADFARAVIDAGLTWIGPSPESITQMGSKIESKRLMAAAGVPMLDNVDPESVTADDVPLLIKASAGGGGRGMRIVRDVERLGHEVEAAAAEASSAFGDGTVFIEPFVERGRHVEVQVVGDRHGTVTVFGDRDCSVQRRHQKVVEEAPAPGLADDVRARLHAAARQAAQAVQYLGAGTVEFLYDADTERFYFLEMNTRLQVEHPVTEEVCAVDLVELQIAVAEGQRLEDLWHEAPPRGHAIEVRLYAENPEADYQPQSGVLTRFEIPLSGGVRVEAGFASGSEVSTHYDAMLAKVIVKARTRERAIRKLAGALREAQIHGLRTNRAQLLEILADEAFTSGQMTTALLNEWAPRAVKDDGDAAVAAALALAEVAVGARTVQRGVPVAWRNVPSQPQVTAFEETEVAWWGGRDGYVVDGVTVLVASQDGVTLARDGVETRYRVAISPTRVDVDWHRGHAAFTRVPRFIDPADSVASGSLLAPMPGTVVKVAVEQGQQVAAGDVVLVLEAMKMQHTVSAPTDGTLTEINVQPGSQVAAGEVLAVVEEEQ